MVNGDSMKKINKMLIKDLRKYASQMIAVILIIFIGITLFSACVMSYKNLQKYKDDFYIKNNFLDSYVEGMNLNEEDILNVSKIEGVKCAQGRMEVDGYVKLDNNENAVAKVIAYQEQPSINKLRYVSGEFITKKNQVLVSKNFAEFHDFCVNDKIEVSTLDQNMKLTIQGVVESPEFIITIKSRDYVMPSIEDYAIIYVSYDTLGISENLFNQIHIKFNDTADAKKIKTAVKDVLGDKFLNYTEQEDQISEVMAREDIGMIAEIAYMFPIMFLFAAALVIFVVQRKLIDVQRSTIGVLKAIGYKNSTIISYYIKQSLILSTSGAVISIIPSYYLSIFITKIYCELVYIPISQFEFDYVTICIAILLSIVFSISATLISVKSLLKISASEAMKPVNVNSVNNKRLSVQIGTGWKKENKMVFNNLLRNPSRTLFSIACNVIAFTLFVAPIYLNDSVKYAEQSQYNNIQNYDYKIAFNETVSEDDVENLINKYNLQSTSAILEYYIKIENEDKDKQLRIIGVENGYKVNDGKNIHTISESGIILPESILKDLNYSIGENIKIKLLEQNDKIIKVDIVNSFKQYVGFSAYIEIEQLRALAGENNYANGIYIVDETGSFINMKHEIEENDFVKRIDSVEREKNEFNTLLNLVNIFILVMIVFGLLMGFSSIYNSTMINVIERQREWGTLKILGYSNCRILMMCLKETMYSFILSIIPSIAVSVAVCYILGILMSNDFYTSPFVINVKLMIYPLALLLIISTASIFIYYYNIKKINTADVIKIKE